MRVKLVQPSAEWLAGDFEPPADLRKKAFLTVWRLQRDFSTGVAFMKVNRGAGLWDKSGHLLFYSQQIADLAPSHHSSDLYSLDILFGACQQGQGVRHGLRRLQAGTFRSIAAVELCVPTGAVEYLVMSHTGNECLATWLDQTQWGYVVVDLKAMTQLPLALYHSAASLAVPTFSPDDAFVVSCSPAKIGWWTDAIDDYWDRPSARGERKLATISIHNLATNEISNHDLVVQLPAGWLPDKPDAAEWSAVWGPEFVSERSFKIWLPDGSIEVLSFPLPGRIELQRPLSTKRKWLD